MLSSEDENTLTAGDHRATTRHVEAISGQKFEFCLMVKQGTYFYGDTLTFVTHIDGKSMKSRTINQAHCKYEDCTRSVKGRDLPNMMLQRSCLLQS